MLSGIKNDYFQWLYESVYGHVTDRSYWLISKILFRKEFYWLVDNDENRAHDGQRLRMKFADEMNMDSTDMINGPCNMFEMLISLAERFDYLVAKVGDPNRMPEWYQLLLENIGMGEFTDELYMATWDEFLADSIINRVLERSYDKKGRGGLFPLKETKRDQRNVEIWYQLNEYLIENY